MSKIKIDGKTIAVGAAAIGAALLIPRLARAGSGAGGGGESGGGSGGVDVDVPEPRTRSWAINRAFRGAPYYAPSRIVCEPRGGREALGIMAVPADNPGSKGPAHVMDLVCSYDPADQRILGEGTTTSKGGKVGDFFKGLAQAVTPGDVSTLVGSAGEIGRSIADAAANDGSPEDGDGDGGSVDTGAGGSGAAIAGDL